MNHFVSVGLVSFAVVFLLTVLANLRVVVSTNETHIVQRSKRTTSYGKDMQSGNTYYRWPAFLPFLGVRVIKLPVSVFNINLNGYAAYDKGRVPFLIDIMAFFRIVEPNVAAQRLSSVDDAHEQLNGILQGVARTILANSEIEDILQGRSQFGVMFTHEVDENLKQWGMTSVKQIELMDIRDAQGSKVIENIMAKKKSLIEMQSRVEVAANQRAAQVAEIEAGQAVQVRNQEAQEAIAIRTAAKEQAAGIAAQKANQAVQEEARSTKEKEMAVLQVATVRQAEITRDAKIVAAQQEKQVAIVEAEGRRTQTATVAEGDLAAAKLRAEGTRAQGEADGAAETARLMAPVNAQLKLAAEIGSNKEYQTYLVTIRTVEKDEAVGKAQAEALQKAEVKVIANTGDVVGGVKSAMELFSSRGGTAVGSALEALVQTPAGKALVDRVTGNGKTQ